MASWADPGLLPVSPRIRVLSWVRQGEAMLFTVVPPGQGGVLVGSRVADALLTWRFLGPDAPLGPEVVLDGPLREAIGLLLDRLTEKQGESPWGEFVPAN